MPQMCGKLYRSKNDTPSLQNSIERPACYTILTRVATLLYFDGQVSKRLDESQLFLCLRFPSKIIKTFQFLFSSIFSRFRELCVFVAYITTTRDSELGSNQFVYFRPFIMTSLCLGVTACHVPTFSK